MNINYIRNLNHNYIKIDSEDDFFEYQVQMITRNNIDGLLKCSDERIDNKVSFLYEINSKQPFVQVFERQKMNFEAFRALIICLKNVVENLSEYLLDVNSIVISPELIYMNPETKDIGLVYLPGTWQNIKSEFHELSGKLLDWVDYKDEKAVTAAYDLFRQTSEENYSLEEILEKILGEEKRADMESSVYKDNIRNQPVYEDKEKNFEQNIFNLDSEIDSDYDSSQSSSIVKKITTAFFAAENWFKKLSLSNKEDVEDEFCEEAIDDLVSYSDYTEKNKAYGILADEETGYGNTVFFQSAVAKNKLLRSIDCNKYQNLNINIYPFIVGKLSEAVDGIIEDSSVSRIHAKIEKADNQYYLVDLNSTNGTHLNGQMIMPNEKTKLHIGDRIQFGFVEYYFENE